jgi:hypothetical protein
LIVWAVEGEMFNGLGGSNFGVLDEIYEFTVMVKVLS